MHSKRLISRLQSIGKIPPKQKRDAHDLLTLFHVFEWYRYVFTSSQYQYESASWDFSDPVLLRLLRWTLGSVVGYPKERGSRDSFVLGYIAEVQARSAAQ